MVRPKKKSSRSASPSELQKQLEQLDRQLVQTLHQRAELVSRLGELPKQDGQSALDDAAERQRLEALARTPGAMPEPYVRRILRELASATRSLVRPIKVRSEERRV